MMRSKVFLILLLVIWHPTVSSQSNSIYIPNEATAGQSIMVELDVPLGQLYVHIVLRSNAEFHVLGEITYHKVLSNNFSVSIPKDAYGDYVVIIELLEFANDFNPNEKSIGVILDNLIGIETFSEDIHIYPYVLSALGVGYHVITWLGANGVSPREGFNGISYTYIYWWDGVNQKYIHYSNITGFGDLIELRTNYVYSYYEIQ